MAVEKFIFQFDEIGLDKVLSRVEEFRESIQDLQDSGTAGDGFERFALQFEKGTEVGLARIKQLRLEVELLKTSLEATPSGIAQTKELSDIGVGDASGQKVARAQVELALNQRLLDVEAEKLRLVQILRNEQQRLVEVKQREANLLSFNNRLEATRVGLLQKVREVKPGGNRLEELIVARTNNLLERQVQLKEQLATEITRFQDEVPRQAAEILQEEVKLSRQLVDAKRLQAQAQREIVEQEKQARIKGFREIAQTVTGASDEERNAVLEQQEVIRQRLNQALDDEVLASVKVQGIENDRAANLERMAAIESGGTGLSRGASEVLNRLREVNRQIAEIRTSSDAVAEVFGRDILGEVAAVERELASFEDRDLTIVDPEEEARLGALVAAATELLQIVETFPEEGIPLELSEEEMLASVSVFNRILLGAARDFGRRFTATLQFAISGALLFGTQRLLREFFDAAVEVERTFADISTSLQFDIDAERGTAAFERSLEGVRRQVLQIADDFNALPVEVNAAAFQMVSRFGDIDAAMTATRAQILATRVATISQEEALRALTAVAESSGVVFGTLGDDQQRQRLQAEQYVKALDFAVSLQQRFGTPVEDTLEGAAGLNELFTGLGFSVQETFAIVATTLRRTGQTGQSVTDKLGRAFSQFTSPQVRNELLALAQTFEEFQLAPGDFFDSGKRAFFRIIDQYSDLDQGLQTKIAQIIGQRRETQFISALLSGGGEGLIDEALGIISGSADAAENRLGILLSTVSGTIEGISQEFQTLAQNLQQLGVITPIKLLLIGLEGILSITNTLLGGVLSLVEALNRIRIPGINVGVGSALTGLVALLSAALAIKSIIKSIVFLAGASGAKSLVGIFRSVLGLQATGAGVAAGAAIGKSLGIATFIATIRQSDGVLRKVGTSMRLLFIAPLKNIVGLINIVKVRLLLWQAALVSSTFVTGGATAAEGALTLARIRTTIATGLLALRGSLAAGALAGAGAKLAVFAGFLTRLPAIILSVLGAFLLFKGVIEVIGGIIGTIKGPGDDQSQADRAAELQAEAEAAGEHLSDAEAKLLSATEKLTSQAGELSDESGRFDAELRSFFFSFLGPFVEFFGGLSGIEGTLENLNQEAARQNLNVAFAEANLLQADLNALNERLGGTAGNIVPSLQEAQDHITDIFDRLATFDPDTGFGPERLGDVRDAIALLFEDSADLIEEYGKALTPEGIREALQQLQTDIQLGRVNATEARTQIEELRKNALEGLRQAEENDEREAAEEYNQALDDLAVADLQFFQQEAQNRLDLIRGLDNNQAKILANLRVLRDQMAEAARNPIFGQGVVDDIQKQILDFERELTDAIREEAVTRAQYEIDNAGTFEERLAAYRELARIIQLQIITEAFRALLFAGPAAAAAVISEGERALSDVYRARADDTLRQNVLIARNAVLLKASALDNIAAIAATVATLRVELNDLRNRSRDSQEIVAKEIEIRDAITQIRLAEADRRAAFFRLTAGTGDAIAAAQAELRSAIDRLATITDRGGAETQAGYEAELAVLQARQSLADLALRQADLARRVTSDLTDSFEQALLDVQAAQEALRRASGDIEKLEAEKTLAEAEARAQREFYDKRLADLDFLFQTDQIGRSQYIAGLRALQAGLDRTTSQGEDLWRQIELQILGLMDQADQAFNIPTEIRLPTLFEVRRDLAADALGVNYQDNREQQINIFISDDLELAAVIDEIESAFGGSIDVEAARNSSGGANITIGAF